MRTDGAGASAFHRCIHAVKSVNFPIPGMALPLVNDVVFCSRPANQGRELDLTGVQKINLNEFVPGLSLSSVAMNPGM
jgi:hypothetical protein